MSLEHVSLEDFTLTTQGPKGRERLGLRGDFPRTDITNFLFSNMGLMHMAAARFPTEISTNFCVDTHFRDLISAMYQADAGFNPSITSLPESTASEYSRNLVSSPEKVAVSYSAGKDSMWNLWWAQKQYGSENVLAIHIRGLNRNNAPNEYKYTLRQQKEIGFPLKVVDLLNSSKNTGFDVMRSRDMFMIGLGIPHALQFGASKIIIEGFAEVDPVERFTGHETNMNYFNQILSDLGIPVQVAWRSDRKEMDCIRDLYEHVPEWMPHVCNCFAAPHFQKPHNKHWKERAPSFPIYDSQCGCCIKCRIITVARTLYDPQMQNVSPEDIRTHLGSAVSWTRTNRRNGSKPDMIEGSFIEKLQEACEKYNVLFRV